MKLWKRIALMALAAACLLGFLLLRHRDARYVSELISETVRSDWETEEKPYAQATVLLEERSAIPQSSLGEVHLAVENALKDAGVPSEDYPWFYAASRKQTATLISDSGSADVELTEVSGDFFRMHPLPIRSGWYMSEEEIMHDRIVLDRNTAWDLFYSDNVAGQYLTWNGQEYVVAAVVDEEPGRFNELAAGGTKRAWVFADSPGSDETQGFTCFEIMLPQPVKKFASTTLLSVLGSYIPPETTALESTTRFSVPGRLYILRNLSTRGISSLTIPYPYWENAARLTENHLALLLIPEGILLLIPLVMLFIFLWRLNRKRTWGLFSIRIAIENAIDRKHARDYEKKYPDA